MAFWRLLLTVLAALIAAGPAMAITGAGVSSALRTGDAVTISASPVKGTKARTCQAGTDKNTGASKKQPPVIATTHKFAVVACEQPPRSEFVSPGLLNKATASALDTIG
jgi:hypothetical protein